MFERDYIMRIIMGFAAALRKALELHNQKGADTQLAREGLEESIGMAADMDANVLLSLEPDSMATILLLGSLDDSVAEYMVHALMLDADYLDEDGFNDTAALRRRQAHAIEEGFDAPYIPERLDALLNPSISKDEEDREEYESQYGAGASPAERRNTSPVR